MSRQLLTYLNGNHTGLLHEYLAVHNGEPRIAWYPSAGNDFRALLYLSSHYADAFPASKPEPTAPDMFVFTDYLPYREPKYSKGYVVKDDGKTLMTIADIEELPRLELPLHSEHVVFPDAGRAIGRVFFMIVEITSNVLGSYAYPVLYVVSSNEAFCCEVLLPHNARISHIIHVRYGAALGGSRTTGIWITHAIKPLLTEVLVMDRYNGWRKADLNVLDYCKALPSQIDYNLRPIRTVPELLWSDHGDVTWYVVE
jgi:hypothetical protein